MSGFVIVFVEMAGTTVRLGTEPVPGAFLKSYDVEAHEGFGDAVWTLDPKQAKLFESQVDAFSAWTTTSEIKPWREHDGKPNRPLTAFTITVEPAPE